jgi:hypothetical protein
MKKESSIFSIIIILIIIYIGFSGCHKKENTVKYLTGEFPDSVYNMTGLNTPYDDYNSDILVVQNKSTIIFSSNRQSKGGQFDLVQGVITYSFDKNNGTFKISSSITTDQLYSSLISKAITSGDDFGPYSMYSSTDGYNYLFLASQNGNTLLDIFYLKYLPQFGTAIPAISGPYPAKLLNSNFDDAYVSFDVSEDSVYFSSNRGGSFNIMLVKKTSSSTTDAWMSQNLATAIPVDSLNTTADEKCPFIFRNYIVFASNRPGGMGGYDLYYSVYKDGQWSTPVNMGPKINSSSDEFRPVLSSDANFSNLFMVFSSNKPGGSGGFDLYFTGFKNR